MKKFTFLLFSLCMTTFAIAQELNVNVTVNTPNLTTVDPAVFKTLESSMQEFLTNQKWTDDVYEIDERIDINFVLTISSENSASNFSAELNVQATRPVYGSDYNTVILSHYDKDVSFTYEQYQPLQYSQGQYNGNLVSILTFYSYLAIGKDYDSFSPFGGEPYFQLAQEIVNTVPQSVANAPKSGWRSIDNKNRYWRCMIITVRG